MAVPKRKTSKARRDKRRNNLWKLTAPTLVKCECGSSLVTSCFRCFSLRYCHFGTSFKLIIT